MSWEVLVILVPDLAAMAHGRPSEAEIAYASAMMALPVHNAKSVVVEKLFSFVALGLAINTPTGNDLRVSLPNSGGDGTTASAYQSC